MKCSGILSYKGGIIMSNRITLSDNLIERIEKICKKKCITFDQFCSNAIYNRVLNEEEKMRKDEEDRE